MTGGIYNKPYSRKTALSPRQIEVVRLLALGHTDKEIGKALGISHATVERHLHNARQFTGARNRTALAVQLTRDGVLFGGA